MVDMGADHHGDRCDAAAGKARGAFSPPPITLAASGSGGSSGDGGGGAGVQENAWSFLALAQQLVFRASLSSLYKRDSRGESLAYLNGVYALDIFSLCTLAVTIVGLIAAVPSSLHVGDDYSTSNM